MKSIQSIDDLEPLISYYAGILGENPGRLMAALSLLADLEFTDDWRSLAPEIRLSLELAKTLTADVFKRLIAEQSNPNDEKLTADLDNLFTHWTNGHHGEGK